MILNGINKLAGMLHANPCRKSLGLEGSGGYPCQHFINIRSGVARCKQNRGAFKTPFFIINQVVGNYPANLFVFKNKITDPCVKVKFPAQLNNLSPHSVYHLRQAVGTYVRMGVRKNLRVRAKEIKDAEHRAYIAALITTRIQLSVRESPRPALAKAVIRVPVYSPLSAYQSNVLSSLAGLSAALNNHRLNTAFQQLKGPEKPGRSGTYNNHRAVRPSPGAALPGRLPVCGTFRLFAYINLIAQMQLELTVSCVNRLLYKDLFKAAFIYVIFFEFLTDKTIMKGRILFILCFYCDCYFFDHQGNYNTSQDKKKVLRL